MRLRDPAKLTCVQSLGLTLGILLIVIALVAFGANQAIIITTLKQGSVIWYLGTVGLSALGIALILLSAIEPSQQE